jgi:hypothetical protein
MTISSSRLLKSGRLDSQPGVSSLNGGTPGDPTRCGAAAETCWRRGQEGNQVTIENEYTDVPAVSAREQRPTPVGRFHTWWRGDPLPSLPRLPGLLIAQTDDARLIGGLVGTDAAEVRERMRQGHQAWLARMAEDPIGWGWCAADELSIGELGIACPLPPGNRYLWDFATVAPWRGHGIYPRLLQTIVASDPRAERFWVGHDFANTASARGIANAGFHEVGVVYRQRDGRFELVPSGSLSRAAAAVALFGVPLAGRPSMRTA